MATNATFTTTADLAADEDSDLARFVDDFTYETETTIATLDFGALVVLLFVVSGLLIHAQSDSQPLQMITSYPYFTLFALCTALLILSLISILFVQSSDPLVWKFTVAVLFLITSISTYLINIIGCKDYRAYICYNTCSACRLSVKCVLIIGAVLFMFCSLSSMVLCGLGLYHISTRNDFSFFYLFLSFELVSMLLLTSISSFYSKISQLQWITVVVFIFLYLSSFLTNQSRNRLDDETRPLFDPYLLYWHPLFVCVISTVSLFGFAPYKKLRVIFLGILGSFFSIFDIVTDVNIILIWINFGAYWWAALQIVFIFSGQLFSAWFVKDYYDKETLRATHKHERRILCFGRVFTLIGLGRIYHSMLAWDTDKYRDMVVSAKVLKVWEMIFESFPTIILQIYITLQIKEQYEWSLVVSVAVSFLSVTFTVFRILFFDHHSLSRGYNLEYLKALEDAKQQKYQQQRQSKYQRDSDLPQSPNSPSPSQPQTNMLQLIEKGYGMAELTEAFGQLQSEPDLKHIDENHSLFVDVMLQMLNNTPVEQIKRAYASQLPPDRDQIEMEMMKQMNMYNSPASIQLTIDDDDHKFDTPTLETLERAKSKSVSEDDEEEKQNSPSVDNKRQKSRVMSVLSISSNHDIFRLELDHPNVQELRNAGYDCSSLQRAWEHILNNTDEPLTFDDDRFQAVMLHTLETELGVQANLDLMDRSGLKLFRKWSSKFICCFFLDLFCCIDSKDEGTRKRGNSVSNALEKINAERRKGSKSCDTCFYVVIYVYIITDFYSRIIPILSYLVIRMLIEEAKFEPVNTYQDDQNLSYWDSYTVYKAVRGEFLAIITFVSLYEYILYRYMLKRPDNNWKKALSYFWTGWFTVSFFLLSTLHLSYLPSNVDMKRLFKEQFGRMLIQLGFAVAAVYFQVYVYQNQFFVWTFYVLGLSWILNIVAALHIRQYSNTFVGQIKHVGSMSSALPQTTQTI